MIQQLYIRLQDGESGEHKEVSIFIRKDAVILLDENENEIFMAGFNSEKNQLEMVGWDPKGKINSEFVWGES